MFVKGLLLWRSIYVSLFKMFETMKDHFHHHHPAFKIFPFFDLLQVYHYFILLRLNTMFHNLLLINKTSYQSRKEYTFNTLPKHLIWAGKKMHLIHSQVNWSQKLDDSFKALWGRNHFLDRYLYAFWFLCMLHACWVVVGGGLVIRIKKHAAALLVGCEVSVLPGSWALKSGYQMTKRLDAALKWLKGGNRFHINSVPIGLSLIVKSDGLQLSFQLL